MSKPAEIEQRVDALLKKMTLEEKVDYLGGVDGFYIRAIERLGLPALKMADGPFGVRNYGPSTAFPAGIALAASWDKDLAQRMGAMIGRDARARGVHFLLAPGVNIYRAPMCGRNFEYFGEDPFLASRITVSYIEGVQAQGVSATVKHFLGNNSEIDRHHTSSDIDERTLREIYLPTFEAAVKEAHVGAVMDAYNLVNGVHMTQHAALNDELLKQEWGFDGIVMSDWDATYDGVAAANGGLDLEMPSGRFMNRATLMPAIEQGKVSVATIDDKVRRILRKAIQFGWLDREQTDAQIPLFSQEGRALAREAARSSMVLLKNERQLLPLDKNKIKSVAVIGPNAYPAVPVGGGSAHVRPFVAISFLQGLADYLAHSATVHFLRGVATLPEIFDSTDFVTATKDGQPGLKGEYFDNPTFSGPPGLTRIDERVNFSWDRPQVWPLGRGKDVSARWTGYFVPPTAGDYRWAVSSYGLNEYRLFIDGNLLVDRGRQREPISVKTVPLEAHRAYALRLEYVHRDHHSNLGLGIRRADRIFDPNVPSLAARADVAIVFAGFDHTSEGEGQDRTFELPLGQDDLIDAVRRANKNTIVVMTSGGGVDMTRWVDQIPAIMQAWYPGQEGGTALAQILFGEFSPTGKLPVTFERRWEDSAVHGSYYPNADNKIAYSEGAFVGYRHFDKAGAKPLFSFGHGLSYTTFQYGGMTISPDTLVGEGQVSVSFEVTNTGAREAAEVSQLYVSDRHASVPRPIKELKGFAKTQLRPGQTKRVEIKLDRRALSYFDAKSRRFRADPGEFEVLVGSSVEAIALRGKLSLR
ncbi:MAG TPA: glycoside hydrolase family 3 C-terminal domain-containing protein [Polyangiaceae bacterium]|nr:glycoside hydrolase family 3 C-terminal domain-containing protein [Polyangiaceae bacterium]